MFLVGCGNTSHQEHSFYGHYKLSKKEIALLQEGDIILRQGQGFVSNLIMKTLKEEISLSHVGLLVLDSAGNFDVIHSVSSTLSDFDGVQKQNLLTFVKESVPRTVVVVRYNKINEIPEKANNLSEQATFYLKQQIPFDHSFDHNDTTHFFCTELIWRVYKEVFNDEIYEMKSNENLLEKLKFYHFFNPEKFTTIINHQRLE
ncbi:MAG: hypothetical protein KGZ97_12390 [Bacteroidetes bacterium]|nr:hypothetical protein [Bacteroidota bacterium]